MYDVKIGQKRKWFKSRRIFTVKDEIPGTSVLICQYGDGTEERHSSFIVNCKSYPLDDEN